MLTASEGKLQPALW